MNQEQPNQASSNQKASSTPKEQARSQDSKQISKDTGGWAYFINNARVTILAVIIILITGTISTISVPKESAPFIAFGIVNVSTSLTGASAEDMDQLVTEKIENKLKNINNVKKIESVSSNSSSNVTIEFEPGIDMVKALSEVRSKVDEAKVNLPDEINADPFIQEIDSSIQPFISVIIYGDEFTDFQLKNYAEDLKTFTEGLNGVAQAGVNGGAEKEIMVNLDPLKLESWNLSAQDVANTIRSSDKDTPVGEFETDSLQYNIRIEGEYVDAEDIKQIALKNVETDGGVTIITVEDVAEVIEQGKDTDQIRRISIIGENDRFERAVEISLSKSLGKNIFDINESVKNEVQTYVEDNFPENLKVSFTKEIAPEIAESYNTVFTNGVQAIVIVMLILFLFVGFRAGIVASFVIPLSFLTTIAILNATGSSLNFLTNFSMILALGILVDTAIVVVEGIEYYLHKGYKPQEAAVRSLHEFKQPLISGALTTLAVFIPLFTLPGVLGQYLAFIPITVFIVITASLFISLLLITSLGAMIMRPQKIKKNGFSFRRKFNKIQSAIVNFYGFLLRGFISSRVMRLGALILITALSLGSCALPIPYVQFPTDDANAFQISIKTPVGTAPEQVALLTQEIEERVIKLPETENIFTTINNNTASLYIELIIKEQRQDLGLRQSTKLVSLLQKEYQNFSRADIRVENPQGGPPSETPVGFRVVAQKKQNIPQAQEVAIELTEELKQIEGTQGVRNNIEIIPGDFVYRINRRKAINLGLNPDQLDGVIRTAVKGTTATTISRDNRDIDVTVRYRPEAIAEINDIYGIRVTNNQGRQIRLEQVIEKELTDSLSTVRRIDGKIAFTVSSFLTDDGNALEISEEFKQIIIDKYDLPEDSTTFNLPNNVSIEDAGENAEGQEVNNALLNGFVIAVLLMTLVLVIQFNSFLQPLLILATILFAQLGVNLGLYLTDTVKSLAYMIGTISLAGIVVNDSIIIVDQMNKTVGKDNRKSVIDSIVYAGKSRFIPVILTTLTTSAGILPLVWTDAFWRSLSITVIGGLTLASLLTLFLTPALFIQLRQEKLLTFSMFTIIGLIGFLLYRIINLMFLNPAINNVALVVVQLVALAVILAIFIGLFIWSLKKARQKDQLLYEPVSS